MTGAIEVCGRPMDADEVLQLVLRDRAFYGSSGGITLSGGEPMMQAEFAFSLLEAAVQLGVGSYVETCGYFAPERWRSL